VQGSEQRVPAPADLSQDQVVGDEDVVEEHPARADGPHAQFGDLAGLHTGGVRGDQEQGLALGPLGRLLVRDGEEEQVVGDVCGGGPHLLPGDAPAAVHLPRLRAHTAEEVGAARRFGDRDREAQSALGQFRTAIIIYTSGTTAAPKGAMLSHEALCRFADTLANDRFRLTPDDRVWVPLPLFHIGGIAFSVMTIHARSVYVHSGFYRPDTALQQLQEERCTLALPCFETIWKPVLDRPDFAEYDLSALRTVLVTGVAERLRAMQEQLPHVVQVSTFGATE